MQKIADFIKQKILQSNKGKLPVLGEPRPVNMTRVLLNPRNILIVPYNRMGTLLMATRVFKSFRDRYPKARITVALHKAWSALIQRDPTIDDLVLFDDFIEDPLSKEFQDFGKDLIKREFDLAFFLSYQFDRDMAYLTRLSGADLRVSFRGSDELDFFNVEITPAQQVTYEADRYLKLLTTIGIPCEMRDYTMTVGDSIREKARLRFMPTAPPGTTGRLVGFDLTREIVGSPLSIKHAENAIKTLVEGLKTTVAVFYEPGKKAEAAALKEVFGKDIMLVEDRPVSLLAGMVSHCRFIVTHNTDLFQLAVALKHPTVAVLTRDEMTQWSPGEQNEVVHAERTSGSWPSASALSAAAKQLIKQTKPK
jgi:ADP-heptose:LPS heptosyltransferase